MKKITHQITVIAFLFSCLIFNACQNEKPANTTVVESDHLKNEIDSLLEYGLLAAWYPKAIDTVDGGFYSDFTHDFIIEGDQRKMIVTQSRHVWTNARAAELYSHSPHFETGAKHGFEFLRDKMWDKENGGFYWLVDKQGQLLDSGDDQKTAYGNTFAIYALAAYFDVFQDSSALQLAQDGFMWLEENSHDSVHLGYFQHMTQDGTPIVRPENAPSGSVLGFKDQNSSIHLLEAFTELYQVWPDSLLGSRLKEMLYLIRDKMITDRGHLTLFFQPDWTPVKFVDSSRSFIEENHYVDHVSFGHDVEIAYLMLEADHVLGLSDPKTLEIAKKAVDHAIDNGWDAEVGGFYDEGYYFKGDEKLTITHHTKNWWAQAEGMNALLLMAERFPDDPKNYRQLFEQSWQYIKDNLIDHEFGGWYAGGMDMQPELKNEPKGHIWKGSYHNFRAMANTIRILEGADH